MCGRIILITPAVDLARALGITEVPAWVAGFIPRYNVAPGQQIPAVVAGPDTTRHQLTQLHWGLVPAWAKNPRQSYRMINARSETVAVKPAFREPFRHRRCIIPVDGFYEWRRRGETQQPYALRPSAGGLFALAGVWERWERPGQPPLETCSILTTDANAAMRPIHDRMPVILAPSDQAEWLETPPQRAERLGELLRPCPPEWLTAYPVDRRVNRPEFDSPVCLAALSDKDPGGVPDGVPDTSDATDASDASDAPDTESGQIQLF